MFDFSVSGTSSTAGLVVAFRVGLGIGAALFVVWYGWGLVKRGSRSPGGVRVSEKTAQDFKGLGYSVRQYRGKWYSR